MKHKVLIKVLDCLSLSVLSCCSLATSASALDIGFGNVGEGSLTSLEIDLLSLLHSSEPFITAVIPILAIVCGLKLGFRLFRKFSK